MQSRATRLPGFTADSSLARSAADYRLPAASGHGAGGPLVTPQARPDPNYYCGFACAMCAWIGWYCGACGECWGGPLG